VTRLNSCRDHKNPNYLWSAVSPGRTLPPRSRWHPLCGLFSAFVCGLHFSPFATIQVFALATFFCVFVAAFPIFRRPSAVEEFSALCFCASEKLLWPKSACICQFCVLPTTRTSVAAAAAARETETNRRSRTARTSGLEGRTKGN